MKQTVNFSEFCNGFRDLDRNKHFTYEGKRALFDYLEGSKKSTEIDVIALCDEYTEYENYEELKEAYPNIEGKDILPGYTTVIKIDNEKFIIQNY